MEAPVDEFAGEVPQKEEVAVGPQDVLARMDNARLSAFHFKAILVAGMGFFTDAYDLFAISLLTRILGRIYFQDNPLQYVASTYGGDVASPWWGVVQNGVNQPYGNGAPQTPGVPFVSSSMIPGGYQIYMPNITSTYGSGGVSAGKVVSSSSTLGVYSAYNKGRVKPGKLPIDLDAAVSSVALCGTLAGQLFFGWAGDKWGRKSVYGLTLAVMIFCAAAQSMSFGTNSLAVIGTLCWWRFFLGFGVGGDYPLSATIMSEYSSRLSRGAFVSAVFAMQGIGILTAATVSIIVTSCFNAYYPSAPYPADDMAGNPALYWSLIQASCPHTSDFIWRVVLGFGCFPAACTMYLRGTMPETPRYTLHVMRDKAKLAADMAGVTNSEVDSTYTVASTKEDMGFGAFLKKHGKELLGCAVCWFMLDVAFYSQNLFQKDIFLQIGWLPPAESVNAMTETFRVARAQALIALGSTIPGYYFTVFTVDKMGRRVIQYMGFIFMTAFMAAIAGGYNHLLIPNTGDAMGLNNLQPTGRNGFVCLYALCFFFANWGPNATTFVIPAELFPTKWKSTGHGISAAAGKAGAIIGAFGFLYASQPAENELTWKFPCDNSKLFEYVTYAKSAGASPSLGAVIALTAYDQNLAVPGFPYVSTSVGLVKPPWKNSLVLPSDVTPSAYIAALNAAQGTTYDAAHYAFGTATSVVAPLSNGTLAVNGVVFGDFVVDHTQAQATPEGITNPHSYGFPQVGFDGKSINTISKLPALSNACLVKANCPGGMIATPAVSNGIKSYQCVCPIPAPLSGCFTYGIGIQGSLGVLAATNFLGMLFTVLVPETNGKTLEQLNGEQEEEPVSADVEASAAETSKTA